MKAIIPIVLLSLIFPVLGRAQSVVSTARLQEELPYDPQMAPFYHGVASGDPLVDRVIIWTRVTPETDQSVEVEYFVATDMDLQDVVVSGTVTTDETKDYTVKVDVTGLSEETTYYYYFRALGKNSVLGRTRTASTNAEHLKFAVVSCSNYEAGYFNAYGRIAERADLDAVIHLGDYIYEYPADYYGNANLTERRNVPTQEIVNLDDYRTRYSLYRLDEDLRKAHQQHPFIVVYDDHETANDSYKDGAENHDEKTEGSWEDRKKEALQAYFEWMPIRESNGTDVERTLSYGDLAEIVVLDSRLKARTKQPTSIFDPVMLDPNHTMLGSEQREWFLEEMKTSSAKWKIVANQVIFSPFSVGFAAGMDDGTPDITNIDSIVAVESLFLDIWDGYPVERQLLIDSLQSNGVENMVWLTGDFHSSMAYDIVAQPTYYPTDSLDTPMGKVGISYLPYPSLSYDKSTGQGAVGGEFVVPSITSANFDENIGAQNSALFEVFMNTDLRALNPALKDVPFEVNYNPHMKYADLDQHGYLVLNVTADSVQGDFYYVDDIAQKSNTENYAGSSFGMFDGENHLTAIAQQAPEKVDAPQLARNEVITSVADTYEDAVLFGAYPNPAVDELVIQYGVSSAQSVRMEIMDINGVVQQSVQLPSQQEGVYVLQNDISELVSGIYFVRLSIGEQVKTRRFIKE